MNKGPGFSNEREFDERIRTLGRLLRKRRRELGLSLAAVSHRCGVSTATLSRLERFGERRGEHQQQSIPDLATVDAVARWLGIDLVGAEPELQFPPSDLVGFVEASLRADRNLSQASAGLLASMFKAAYEQAVASDHDATEPEHREDRHDEI